MEESVEVRRLGASDWATWRDIRLRALAQDPDGYCATLAEEEVRPPQVWRRGLSTAAIVVAFVDSHPVACGAGVPLPDDRLGIGAMWTDPAFRGRGLATMVLDALAGLASSEGRQLVLDVARGNRPARALYEGYGFTPTGESAPLRQGSAEWVDTMRL